MTGDIREQMLKQIDKEIRGIIRKLWDEGIETYWSCSGRKGHLCGRPTIIISNGDFFKRKDLIKKVKKVMGRRLYWLSEVWSYVKPTSGMTHYWMLEIMGKEDWIAYPIYYRRK